MDWTAGVLMPPGGFVWAFVAAGVVVVVGLIVWTCAVLAGREDDRTERAMLCRYELWIAGRCEKVLDAVASDEEARQVLRDVNGPSLPYRGSAAEVTTSKAAIWCLEPGQPPRLVCGNRR